MTPLRTCEAAPVLVEAPPLTLAPVEGATLAPLTLAPAEGATLVPALAAGEMLLVVDDDPVLLELVPVEAVVQAGLAAAVAPPVVAPAAVDGRAEALLIAPVLAGAEAATLVRAAPLAAVLAAVDGGVLVLVLGPAVPALPHAASTSEAAASVGKRGRSNMDGFLRVDLAAPGMMSVPKTFAGPLLEARTTRAISV